jgi:hypothetical protein
MKILLDECLPLDFRHKFPDHDTHTAEWAGLKGKKMVSYYGLLNLLVMRSYLQQTRACYNNRTSLAGRFQSLRFAPKRIGWKTSCHS